ncbi:MAG: D-glycero-beta-D-manno-heptose-7-phosphate kinase [Candidatus Sumerlaeota bacterium]|nr:D-glycero-beta-D-manno-heptose-7-phosphate kinase [Candidatus Sumerlaeota bacterium]
MPARPSPTPGFHEQTERLESIVHGFRGRAVLVVGDIILDRYVWGDVSRISPEAPAPVVRLRDQTSGLGGAANVVANLAALGARPALVGVVGADAAAAELRSLLSAIGVGANGLVVDRARPTTVKTRVMSMGHQLLRLDREDDSAFPSAVARRLVKAFAHVLPSAEVVVFSDYDKGVLAPGLCEMLLSLAKQAGKPTLVDPKGADYRKYRGATILKPNEKEAAAAGLKIGSDDALAAAARSLQKTAQCRAVVVTRGGLGVSVFERGKPPAHFPARARSVYDVTGAGDSFVAAMAAALAAGASVAEAARIGNAAGAIVVGKLGAATTEPAELLAWLEPGRPVHKLRSVQQMRAEVEALRAAGRRIVFTNGCFDLLHLGHIKFLERARQLGDALIVALNSDRSVRAIKAPPRPVLNEEERASILASLDAVDYILIFDEPTPERLLALLRPDILVKGKTQRADEVVGREIVESHGGKVVLLPLLGETTTDAMVERIARQTKPHT